MAKKSFQWPGRRPDDPAHDMLAAYLVVDIQRNLEWAKQLAERIRSVQTGKIAGWERIGNAYRLELTADGALIEDLIAEDGCVQTVALEELSKAVETWIALQS
jgi:hypothetical protein